MYTLNSMNNLENKKEKKKLEKKKLESKAVEVVVDNEIKLLTLANMSHPKKIMLLSLLLLRIGNRIYTRRKKNIYILLNHNKISRMIFALIILACIVCRNPCVFEVITISSFSILQENE